MVPCAGIIQPGLHSNYAVATPSTTDPRMCSSWAESVRVLVLTDEAHANCTSIHAGSGNGRHMAKSDHQVRACRQAVFAS